MLSLNATVTLYSIITVMWQTWQVQGKTAYNTKPIGKIVHRKQVMVIQSENILNQAKTIIVKPENKKRTQKPGRLGNDWYEKAKAASEYAQFILLVRKSQYVGCLNTQ